MQTQFFLAKSQKDGGTFLIGLTAYSNNFRNAE